MSYIDNLSDSFERGVDNFCIEALWPYVKADFIHEALARTGRASRRVRKLPAHLVMWFMVAAGLFKDSSISNVLWTLGLPPGGAGLWDGKPPSSTAFSRARSRLGVEPLLVLAEMVAGRLEAAFGGGMGWRGMRLLTIDGLTLKVADSKANRAYWGAPGQNRGRTAFPQMRAVLVESPTHHFVLHAALAPYRVGEVTLALGLLGRIGSGSLVLLDRGLMVYRIMCALKQQGSDFIVRVRKDARMETTADLGGGQWLARIRRPARGNADLPQDLTVRVVRCDCGGKETMLLATSLLDAGAQSAQEIAMLYAKRWEAETMRDEIKTHQCKAATVNRPLICRSRNPERAAQEAVGLLIAYNATRALMAVAAQKAGQDPVRISFSDAIERVRHTAVTMAGANTVRLTWLYRSMLDHIANMRLPARRARSNPRVVRVKFSGYPVKRKKTKVA